MSLSLPKDSSFPDRAYIFLQSRAGCWAALLCLWGGLLCSWGIARQQLWAIVIGGILMVPYALAALVFVTIIALCMVMCFFFLTSDFWQLLKQSQKRRKL